MKSLFNWQISQKHYLYLWCVWWNTFPKTYIITTMTLITHSVYLHTCMHACITLKAKFCLCFIKTKCSRCRLNIINQHFSNIAFIGIVIITSIQPTQLSINSILFYHKIFSFVRYELWTIPNTVCRNKSNLESEVVSKTAEFSWKHENNYF